MRDCLKIALAASLALAAPALAAEGPSAPKFNLMGPSTCAGWPKTGSISSASKAVPLNWVLGYVSGWASYSDIRLLDMVDPEEVDAWLTTYCKDHPADTLPVAARTLERELEARLPPVEPPAPPMFVTPPPKAEPPPKAAPAKKPPVRRRAPARKPAPKPPAPTAPAR